MNGASLTHDDALAKLVLLMRELGQREFGEAALQIDCTMELRDVPITSRTMRTFLVAVEDEFDIEWDIDTPEEVFRSFSTLAAHLVGGQLSKETMR